MQQIILPVFVFVIIVMAPKWKTPRNYIKADSDISYWNRLWRCSVYRANRFNNNNKEWLNKRCVKRDEQLKSFKSSYRFIKRKRGRASNYIETTKCLIHWVKFISWSYCNSCGLLEKNSMTPKSFNSKGARYIGKCGCKSRKYIIPSFTAIPKVLSSLTKDEESILRIFDIDIGVLKVACACHKWSIWTQVPWKYCQGKDRCNPWRSLQA